MKKGKAPKVPRRGMELPAWALIGPALKQIPGRKLGPLAKQIARAGGVRKKKSVLEK